MTLRPTEFSTSYLVEKTQEPSPLLNVDHLKSSAASLVCILTYTWERPISPPESYATVSCKFSPNKYIL